MQEIVKKYAKLLVNYCLAVKKDDKIYINSSYLAEPLLREVAREIYLAGGHPIFNIELNGVNDSLLEVGEEHQLLWVNPMKKLSLRNLRCVFEYSCAFPPWRWRCGTGSSREI
jgi:aminopeptidase